MPQFSFCEDELESGFAVERLMVRCYFIGMSDWLHSENHEPYSKLIGIVLFFINTLIIYIQCFVCFISIKSIAIILPYKGRFGFFEKSMCGMEG